MVNIFFALKCTGRCAFMLGEMKGVTCCTLQMYGLLCMLDSSVNSSMFGTGILPRILDLTIETDFTKFTIVTLLCFCLLFKQGQVLYIDF